MDKSWRRQLFLVPIPQEILKVALAVAFHQRLFVVSLVYKGHLRLILLALLIRPVANFLVFLGSGHTRLRAFGCFPADRCFTFILIFLMLLEDFPHRFTILMGYQSLFCQLSLLLRFRALVLLFVLDGALVFSKQTAVIFQLTQIISQLAAIFVNEADLFAILLPIESLESSHWLLNSGAKILFFQDFSAEDVLN